MRKVTRLFLKNWQEFKGPRRSLEKGGGGVGGGGWGGVGGGLGGGGGGGGGLGGGLGVGANSQNSSGKFKN